MRPSYNYIPPEQFNSLIESIPLLKIRKWSDNDVAMLFKIAYWCGLRINEAIRLKAEDFDLDLAKVYLGKTKTEKSGRGTIPAAFMPELKSWLVGKAGPLFHKMNYPIVYHWLVTLGEILNIEALITPQSVSGEKTKTHIFRKSVGKDMIYGTRDGVKLPLNIVQKKLRHTTLDMTSNYLKVGDEDVSSVGW